MNISGDLVVDPQVETTITLKEVTALARFSDPRGGALSFYLCSSDVTKRADRSDTVAIKDLIRNISEEVLKSVGGIDKDLAAILATGHRIRSEPNHLHAVFACLGQHVWREFNLPVTAPQISLRRGRHFGVAPLVRALHSLTPYGVLLVESGKARLFIVDGTDIQELHGRLPFRDLSLHAEDSRVGWSHHVEGNQSEHEKSYFKDVFRALKQLLRERSVSRLVIGCREDLWGEIGHLFTAIQEHTPLIGRFNLRDFAEGATDILELALPVVERSQKQRVQELFSEIDNAAIRAYGIHDVLQALIDGRARKLILTGLPGHFVAECMSCGGMASMTMNHKCVFCNSTMIDNLEAEEAMTRLALLTDVEIVYVDAHTIATFDGAVALLRY